MGEISLAPFVVKAGVSSSVHTLLDCVCTSIQPKHRHVRRSIVLFTDCDACAYLPMSDATSADAEVGVSHHTLRALKFYPKF